MVKANDLCVHTETNDTFGQIASGSIYLEGPMCRFQRSSLDSSNAIVLTANRRTFPSDLIHIDWDVVSNNFLKLSRFAQ